MVRYGIETSASIIEARPSNFASTVWLEDARTLNLLSDFRTNY